MDTVIEIGRDGTLTLPAEIREKYHLAADDTIRVLDLDGILVLTPMVPIVPIVPELAREIERARLAAGLSIDELLGALREQRVRYAQEQDTGTTDA